MANNPAKQIAQRPLSDTVPAPKTGLDWRRVRSAARWVATAALLAWLAFSTDWQGVSTAIGSGSSLWLLVAFAIYLASQIASVARWHHLVRAAGITQSRTSLLASYFEGMFVNVCLPTTVGGDMLKAMRVGGNQNKLLAASTVFADRLAGLLALVNLLAVALLLQMDSRGIAMGVFVACVVACVVAALVSLPITVRKLRLFDATNAGRSSGQSRTRVAAAANKLWLRLISVRQLATRAPWFRVFAWAFLVQSLNVAAVVAAGYAVGLTVPLTTMTVATTTVSLASALPISIAGVGVREASLPLLLATAGAPREVAVALGIVWSVIVLSSGLLGGPIHFIRQFRPSDKFKSPASSEPVAHRVAA